MYDGGDEMSKAIVALDSVVSISGSNSVVLSELPPEERKPITQAMCEYAGKQMSDYFSVHLDEWKDFVNIINVSKK